MGRRVLRFDGAFGHTFGVRVQRVQKVQSPMVRLQVKF